MNATVPTSDPQILGNFTLNSTALSALSGGHYRILAKLFSRSITPDTRLHAATYYPAGAPLNLMQRTPDILTKMWGNCFIDLGTLQLPPWLPGVSPLEALSLVIWGRKTGGFNVGLDNLLLMPNYRLLRPRGFGFAQNTMLADDGFTDSVWTQIGSDKAGFYAGYGEPIKLVPGMDQTIIFATSNLLGEADITQSMTVKLFYRPRRLEA